LHGPYHSVFSHSTLLLRDYNLLIGLDVPWSLGETIWPQDGESSHLSGAAEAKVLDQGVVALVPGVENPPLKSRAANFG